MSNGNDPSDGANRTGTRTIATIIAFATDLAAQSDSIENRLHSIRDRLQGAHPREEPKLPTTDRPEEVRAELDDLRHQLDRISRRQAGSEEVINQLEQV